MDHYSTQRFGIVCLEALNHEFDRGVILEFASAEAHAFQPQLRGLTIFAIEKSVISKTSV